MYVYYKYVICSCQLLYQQSLDPTGMAMRVLNLANDTKMYMEFDCKAFFFCSKIIIVKKSLLLQLYSYAFS